MVILKYLDYYFTMSLTPPGSDTVFKFMTLRAPEKHKEIKTVKINPAVLSPSVYFKAVSKLVATTKLGRQKLVPQYSALRDSIINKMLDKETIQHRLVDEQLKSFEKVVAQEETTQDEVRQASRKLVASSEFAAALENLDDFISFADWLESQADGTVSIPALEGKVSERFRQGSSALVNSANFKSAKVRISEGIVAMHFADSKDAAEEDRMIVAMRAIAIIERIARKDKKLRDPGDLKKSLDAVIALPPDIFDKADPVPQPIRKLPPDSPRVQARNLASRLKRLEAARSELQATKVEDTVVKELKTPALAATTTGKKIKQRAASIFLAPTAVAKLSGEATKLLGELALAPKDTELAHIESALDAEEETLSAQLYSLPGIDASEGIDELAIAPSLDVPQDVLFLVKSTTIPAAPSVPNLGPTVFTDPSSPPKKEGYIAGISDLMVVKQRIRKYVPGEIAHIENVVAGEYKERTHRTLDRKEELAVLETELTEETQKELATTERFELQQAAEETIKEDSSLKTGIDLTVRYGKVFEGNWNLGYEKNKSKEESNKESSTRAKEITEKSIEKITSKVTEKQSITIIHEIEEINKHGIDNKEGDEHVRGIYQWVDKYYCVELVNYGRRLMLDFVIPEPAKFLNYAMAKMLTSPDFNLVKPKKPYNKNASRDLRPDDITTSNYLAWASMYRASVSPPPKKIIYQTHVVVEPPTDGKDHHFHNASMIQLEDGYYLDKVYVGIGRSSTNTPAQNQQVDAIVSHCPTFGTSSNLYAYDAKSITIAGQIPVQVAAVKVAGYSVSVEMKLTRSDSLLQKWQIETYQKIIEGYFKMKAEYDEKLADYKRAKEAVTFESKSSLGLHPDRNRQIEREELKKLCLMMMIKNHLGGKRAMSLESSYGYPELDFSLAEKQGTQIQFFEHAIEWEQMMYIFYPYFWGAKFEWDEEVLLEEQDPQFEQFRKAGAARVVVSVHPNFEEVFLHFTRTGKIWKGASKPQVDDALYLSIIEEIRAQQDAIEGGEVIDRWEFKVPTSLVYLKEDGDLPEWEPCEEKP